MKKIVSMMAFAAILFSTNANAQETEPVQKKKEHAKKECKVNGKKCCSSAKEEKACTGKVSEEKVEGKKACSKDEKKGKCCSAKKEETK
jgi:hypothetical protein